MPTGDVLIAQINELTVLPNSLALWGLGQMGLVVKGPDAVIYLDPCLSHVISERAFPPPLSPEQITDADWVLCSHEHIDHLDPETLKPLAAVSPTARFVVPGWCIEQMTEIGIDRGRIIVPEALKPMTLPDTTLRLTAVPSAHYAKEYDPAKGYRYLGFLLEWNNVTLYFAGDTILYDDYLQTMRRLPQADIAMLPVNGRDYFRETKYQYIGNLHPVEAAQLAAALGWSLVIAGHNDLVPTNTIPMGEIAQAFADHAPRQAYKVLQPGELLYYVKG
jgi:L-ascorbate 6-phosphate lactonase